MTNHAVKRRSLERAENLHQMHTIDATLREPAIVEQTRKMLMIIDHMDQRSYQNFCVGEYKRWGQYIRTAKVTVDQ